MKKTMSLLVAMLILMANLVFPVSAATDAKNEGQAGRDELIALACEVFPEYAEKITSKRTSTENPARSSASRTLIREVDRETEDGSILTYAEYSDGFVLLTNINASFGYTSTITDMEIEKELTTVTLSVTATSNYFTDGYYVIRNICFVYVPNGNDYITNRGTAVKYGSGLYIYEGYPTVVYNETASQNARIVYRIHWGNDTGQNAAIWPSALTIEVGDDSYSVTHVGIM